MMKSYYLLTKPGIVMGNLITTAGGFALASKGEIDFGLFFAMLIGLGPVIASACVCNNYIDRISDAKMARTQNRALARGLIAPWKAICFALVLGIFGVAVLSFYTNYLAAGIAATGFFVYVVLYSLWKSRSMHATLVGSISGAIPPVVGYCAVSHRLDAGAVLLFAILVLWQMPHFFAIAMYRQSEYAAASIPVLPNKRGVFATKVQMLLYVIAFAAATLLLMLFGYVGTAYVIVASLLSTAWLYLTVKGFKAENDRLWARSMFRLSLVIITVLCVMISVDTA
jgi:protoheme IX farnesyltransferase